MSLWFGCLSSADKLVSNDVHGEGVAQRISSSELSESDEENATAIDGPESPCDNSQPRQLADSEHLYHAHSDATQSIAMHFESHGKSSNPLLTFLPSLTGEKLVRDVMWKPSEIPHPFRPVARTHFLQKRINVRRTKAPRTIQMLPPRKKCLNTPR